MGIERLVDEETYQVAIAATQDAYRRAAEIVAPRLTEHLVAAAGQTISAAELEQLLEQSNEAYGDAYLDAIVAGGIALGVLPPDFVIFAGIDDDEAVSNLASIIRDLLDTFLEEAIREGLPAAEIRRKLLKEPASPLSPKRAEALARTSVNAATNAGFAAAFKAAGVPAVSWITRRDEKVRDAHAEADRDVVPNGIPFDIDGHEAYFPADPRLPIGLRINCRCVLGWVDGEQIRRTIDATRRELYSMARQLDITGRGKMTKPQLQLAVVNAMCLQGLAAGSDCPDTLDDMNMPTLLIHARMASIRGRYRMRRAELLAAVKSSFVTPPTGVGQFATLDHVPFSPQQALNIMAEWMNLQPLADRLVSGQAASVHPKYAADLIEILGRHTEPVDLTLLRATSGLFTPVAQNPFSRGEMPQIPEGHLDGFATYLRNSGVTLTSMSVNPISVAATQNELDGRKVGKMITAIRNDQFRPEHPAFVSADGRILDGHHRWAAQATLAMSGRPQFMPIWKTSIDIESLLDHAHEYAESHAIESKTHGMAYNPNQPRHSAGSSVGGRWRPLYDGAGRPVRQFPPGSRPSIWDRQQARLWNEEQERITSYERDFRVVETPNRDQIERFEGLHGRGMEALFPEGSAPTAVIPFPSAGRRKGEPLYDRDLVAERLAQPVRLSVFDPRTLHATQPGVTKPGVDYYMAETYAKTGRTYADQNAPGNRYPVIYRNPSNGQFLILSGHHRATAALLSGSGVHGIMIDPRIRVIR